LRRAIEQRIEDPLGEELLRGAFEGHDTIVIGVHKDEKGKITRLDFSGESRGWAEETSEDEAVAAAAGEAEAETE
ncbi:MAG: hypothetical protein AAF539_14975, partial [Planctomycetota bacterium]